MEVIFLVLLFAVLMPFFVRPRPEEGNGGGAEASLAVIPLLCEDGRDFVERDGVRYWAYEGEMKSDSPDPLWIWHGRMGEGIGYLVREGGFAAIGELYSVRGSQEFLLAHLPQDGWPITDMRLFIRADSSLPSFSADAFARAVIYHVRGAFSEEEYERVGETCDPAFCEEIFRLWTEGEAVDLPEGEYERYRVRLYSSEVEGLYVSLTVHVDELRSAYAVERFDFGGDALLSPVFSPLFRRDGE